LNLTIDDAALIFLKGMNLTINNAIKDIKVKVPPKVYLTNLFNLIVNKDINNIGAKSDVPYGLNNSTN
jgi:hypothetical protein